MGGSLARISEVERMLATIGDVADAVAVQDAARLMREYAKIAGLSVEEVHRMAEAQVTAIWKGGRLLTALERNEKGLNLRRGARRPAVDVGESPYATALEGSGLSRQDASRWQKVGEFSEEELAVHKTRCRGDDAPITAAYLLRAWRREKKTAKPIPEADEIATASMEDIVESGLKFGTIYADPPWLYGNQGTRGATGDHYPGMTVEEIAALPVPSIVADNAHLHLWTTNAFLFDAKAIIEAWGFEYKSCFVWVKPQMGMGNYWRVSHEFCLLGVRGTAPFGSRSEMSWAQWPRGRHSAKPGRMYELIEKVSPGPFLEMFARERREKWSSWGNGIEPNLFFQEAV